MESVGDSDGTLVGQNETLGFTDGTSLGNSEGIYEGRVDGAVDVSQATESCPVHARGVKRQPTNSECVLFPR